MENDLVYNNDQLCIEYGGKDYPIETVEVRICLEATYLVERKGIENTVFTAKPGPDDKTMTTLVRGDVLFIVHVPSAESMDRAYTLMVMGTATERERRTLADLYRFIRRGNPFPISVVSSAVDVKDARMPLFTVTMGQKYKPSGRCDYCEERAMDSCTLCGKDLCNHHDILCKADPVLPALLGYCEDCLFLLNMVPLPAGAMPKNRKHPENADVH